jgi:hypothetical protein
VSSSIKMGAWLEETEAWRKETTACREATEACLEKTENTDLETNPEETARVGALWSP